MQRTETKSYVSLTGFPLDSSVTSWGRIRRASRCPGSTQLILQGLCHPQPPQSPRHPPCQAGQRSTASNESVLSKANSTEETYSSAHSGSDTRRAAFTRIIEVQGGSQWTPGGKALRDENSQGPWSASHCLPAPKHRSSQNRAR